MTPCMIQWKVLGTKVEVIINNDRKLDLMIVDYLQLLNVLA